MIGKLITAFAGRSLARNVGGAAAGPVGAAIGLAIPFLVPTVARALGPVGMLGAAAGGLLFTRYMKQQKLKNEALAGLPPRAPLAVLGANARPVDDIRVKPPQSRPSI